MFQDDLGSGTKKTRKNERTEKDEKQTIFKSPFISSEPTNFIPDLRPPKRVISSPVKRNHKRSSYVGSINLNDIHSRNRKPLSFTNNKQNSMVDDFQSKDFDGNDNALANFPVLQPPRRHIEVVTTNKEYNINTLKLMEPEQKVMDDKDIFSLDLNPFSENTSIFSMVPTGASSSVFDFNSYLKSVTSNLKSASELTSNITKSMNLLDLSNPIKVDLIRDKQLISSLDLDCVRRSSTWDSDVETEDGLDLEFNFEQKNNIESQIPSLYDPFNKVLTGKKYQSYRNASPILGRSGIPLKIYSDNINVNKNIKVKSPNTSQESDNTLWSKHLVVQEIKKDLSQCEPHHRIFVHNLKSAIKPIPKNMLNLIVEASDGSLEDATKYATEINAQNSVGVPVPEKVTELVNIPTNGPTVNGVRKSAIIRGIKARTNLKDNKREQKDNAVTLSKYPDKLSEYPNMLSIGNNNWKNITANINSSSSFKGFYSLKEKHQFQKRNTAKVEGKENVNAVVTVGFKRSRGNETYSLSGRKHVNWAESLEW